jgi:hypothetical protein
LIEGSRRWGVAAGRVSGKFRVWEVDLGWVSRFQHGSIVARERGDLWLGQGFGGDLSPHVEELRRADAITKAVVDGSAKDHPSAC